MEVIRIIFSLMYVRSYNYVYIEIDFHSFTPALKGASENQFPPFRAGVKKLIFHDILIK